MPKAAVDSSESCRGDQHHEIGALRPCQLCGTTHLYSGWPLKLQTWKPFSMAAAANREGGAAVELEKERSLRKHALASNNTTANRNSEA